MIRLQKAEPVHAAELAAIQREAFDRECERYGKEELGGPPGYADEEWQKTMMREACYYLILDSDSEGEEQADKLVGGAVVFPDESKKLCHLGRIFLQPCEQNRGLGRAAMRALEEQFPWAEAWELDTPDWELKNHRFYPRCGYRLVRAERGFFYYEKKC